MMGHMDENRTENLCDFLLSFFVNRKSQQLSVKNTEVVGTASIRSDSTQLVCNQFYNFQGFYHFSTLRGSVG